MDSFQNFANKNFSIGQSSHPLSKFLSDHDVPNIYTYYASKLLEFIFVTIKQYGGNTYIGIIL